MGKTYDLTVNVMMVGGRRCGKTSVLVAMQNCFDEQCKNTPLMIGPANNEMLKILVDKQRELTSYFLERGNSRDFWDNSVPSREDKQQKFYVGLKDKNSRIIVNFIDYPGEWLDDECKEHSDMLNAYMESSRILLVAIDTPHLMEQKGLYNDLRNCCNSVSQMVRNVGFSDAEKGPGMILFVPMKCERYYNRDQMESVSAKVQEAYKPLLQYLLQPGTERQPSRITVAVTPILTLGGAEFSRFERYMEGDRKGEIVLDEKWRTPAHTIYHFPDMTKDKPEPKYCEQPMLYVLSYVLKQAEEEKRKKGLLGWLQSVILKWPSANDYLKQARTIDEKRKRDGDGYIVLSKGILR